MQSATDFVTSRPRTSALYALFTVSCVLIYRSLQAKETGQYDYVLTLSAGLQALAFAFLVCDTRSQVAEGLSEKSLWAFFIAHVARLSTTFWGEGYVPEDNTADIYLYQCLEVSGVVLLAYKMLNLKTLRTIHDVGQGLERWHTLIGMVAVAMALSFVTKSTGHNDYFADLSWIFSVWLEAFALFPQVLLLSKTSHLDESAVHFAGVTLMASLSFAAFWWKNAMDRYTEFMKDGYHGFLFGIVTAGAIRVGLCGYYFYLFTRNTKEFKGLTGKGEYELCAQQDEEL